MLSIWRRFAAISLESEHTIKWNSRMIRKYGQGNFLNRLYKQSPYQNWSILSSIQMGRTKIPIWTTKHTRSINRPITFEKEQEDAILFSSSLVNAIFKNTENKIRLENNCSIDTQVEYVHGTKLELHLKFIKMYHDYIKKPVFLL